MYTLQRWNGDMNAAPATTEYETMAELIADVRANDNLTENEFYEFLRIGSVSRSDRCVNYMDGNS